MNVPRPLTDVDWAAAEMAARAAGLSHERRGMTLWCWPRGRGCRNGGYVDVIGLVESEDPVDYARQAAFRGRPDSCQPCPGSSRPEAEGRPPAP